MIRTKLMKKLPVLLVALGIVGGVFLAEDVKSYADNSNNLDIVEIDPGFAIREFVYVNGQEVAENLVKIQDEKVYVSVEAVTQRMGDILEGDITTQYYLRKADKMVVMNGKDKVCYINGEENKLDCIKDDENLYVTLDFIKDVLGYPVSVDGNVHFIGTEVKLNENASSDVMPEVFINGELFPSFGTLVRGDKLYLPIEALTYRMGDMVIGDVSTQYTIRNNDKLIIILQNEDKYLVNGEEKAFDGIVYGEKVYISVDFAKEVLGYEVNVEGNTVNFGQALAKAELNDTYPNAQWISENGAWFYVNNGAKVTGWAAYNNSWYYMKEDGTMATGWIKVNENWYFLNNDGTMATGWVNDGNTYYYLNEDGSMAASTIVDGFQLAENGVCAVLY